MVNCSGCVRAVWPGVGITMVRWLMVVVAEAGDRLPAICVTLSVVLAVVAYCSNCAIKDDSCTWQSSIWVGGQTH